MYLMETRLRTLVRSLTWRFFGVVLAILLTWWYTGSWTLGVEMGLAYNAIRLVTHYVHDRAWARLPWGMTPQPGAGAAAGATAPGPVAAMALGPDGLPRSDDLEPMLVEWASD